MKKTGVIIVAAGMVRQERDVSPLREIGSISVIRRMVLTFQQAGVAPIVVITGYQSLEIEQHLADYGVIFLKNEAYEHSDKFSSACIGLKFIQDKCSQVFFTSVSIPMYTAHTLRCMADMKRQIVVPSYEGRIGHPLLFQAALIPRLLQYTGSDGMRGAIQSLHKRRAYLNVEDAGILLEAQELPQHPGLIDAHTRHLLHPFVRVSIEREKLFFNTRARMLLLLIQEMHSVKGACIHMALSLGKAWDMINDMEAELGCRIVERKHGGNQGGRTELTTEGAQFLQDYQRYELEVQKYAKKQFDVIFRKYE